MIHNYIDLHCHTIASKYKTGESEKRNVPNKECFLNAMRKNQVSVVAITNHNYFDSKQFEDFKDNEDVVVFPGIELDIVLLMGILAIYYLFLIQKMISTIHFWTLFKRLKPTILMKLVS